MQPTNPQDIADALAFLAEQGVIGNHTGFDWTYEPDEFEPDYFDFGKEVLPAGWYRDAGKYEPPINIEDATDYDTHAITNMLAVWLRLRHIYLMRNDETGEWHSFSIIGDKKCWPRLLDCDDNPLAAHLTACREVSK